MSARSALAFSPGSAGPVLPELDWRSEAACGSQPHLFFGPDGETASQQERRERKAKALCAVCPVRAQCWALFRAVRATHGVWGGTGEKDHGRGYTSPHTSRADRARLEAILAAGERQCSGKCGMVRPLEEFPARGGTCRSCLADQMREINRRRSERRQAHERQEAA